MIIITPQTSFKTFVDDLLTYYGSAVIPYPVQETNWKAWGNSIISSGVLSSKGIPSTELFSNWQKWGIMFYETLKS
jgi:hypothetical protein